MSLPVYFENQLEKSGIITAGDKLFVACSGGPDSVALFYLLMGLRDKWRLRLSLLHFNHGLRGRDSDADEDFVRKLAEKRGVPICVGRAALKAVLLRTDVSWEAAARKARYDFFLKTAKKHKISKVALAHTQDDQAETILMRIFQGTGLRGLNGIRLQLGIGGISFVRPLLTFKKKEVEDFLAAEKIRYRRDRSNRTRRFVRNRIRLDLIPWLASRVNPRVVEALARIPAIVHGENRLLSELEKVSWKKVFASIRKDRIYLKKDIFLKLPPALQYRLLDKTLKKLDGTSGLSFEAWERLRSHLCKSRHCHSLPRDIDLLLTPSQLVVYRKHPRTRKKIAMSVRG